MWTLLHDLDGSTLCVTRLRAWSGITGWRFESSSAHQKALHGGASVLSIPTCRTRRRARGNFLGNVRRPTQPRLRVATALVRREGLPAGRGALEATLRDPASNTVRRSALVRASPGAKALLSHRSYPDADWPAVRISWIPTVGGSSASDAPPDPRG